MEYIFVPLSQPWRRSVAHVGVYVTTQLPPLDLGKVLTGIQVPSQAYDQFQQFLDKLGYHYVEETNNEVYKRYLRG